MCGAKRLGAERTLAADYPEYSLLAARIAVSNLHKETKKGFVEVMTDLRNYINPKTQAKAPLISETGMLCRWICKKGCGWFSRAACHCLCLAGCRWTWPEKLASCG